jgi:hypothetical protein
MSRRRKKVKTFMLTHAEREALEEPQSFVFSPVLLFGPVNRPLFEIDESELPYWRGIINLTGLNLMTSLKVWISLSSWRSTLARVSWLKSLKLDSTIGQPKTLTIWENSVDSNLENLYRGKPAIYWVHLEEAANAVVQDISEIPDLQLRSVDALKDALESWWILIY